MFDDLSAYFHENIITAYKQYKEEKEKPVSGRSNDLRLAINAAIALYHFREHLPKQHAKTRKQLSQNCPDYDLLGDVVNASKHKKLIRKASKITSAEKIYEEIVETKYVDSKGEYFHNEKFAIVELNDGTRRDLFEVLTNVLNMWFSELYNMGVLQELQRVNLPQKGIPSRSSDSGIPRLDLMILRGVRFKQRFKLQKYNYNTGQVEPIDLTGYKIRGRIYKPTYEIDFKLVNEKTGEEIIRTLKLSEEQNKKLLALSSGHEIQSFMTALAEEQGILQDMAKEIKEKQSSQQGDK